MKNILTLLISILILSSCQQKVTIVISESADSIESFAANELSKYLSILYLEEKFSVSKKAGKGKSIYLRIDSTTSLLPDSPEGYLVEADEKEAFIISKGSTGLVYGVYGILEKLGCGFFLSDEFVPKNKNDFSFEAWNISDSPLIKERYVFNWHNFISGCTGWDKEQWLEWIDRSQKMGYNAVMVHAYHNNPMYTYEFKGHTKEVGFINTSGKGRDWGNIPINDVRRLPGGDIYENEVFGSEIALVPDSQRVQVAQQTMSEVFSYALDRGVQVCFAIDIDMPLSFMKNTLIQEIPEEDKFFVSKPNLWIPDPGKTEGYEFYKSQIVGLLDIYPMLERISLFRRGSSFFRDIRIDELPEAWNLEYQEYLTFYPFLNELDHKEVICSFVTSKLVLNYKRILEDIGRDNIQLSTGSWAHDFVLPTATFLPKEIKLMPIDWDVRLDRPMLNDSSILDDFSNSICQNRVVPFIWAHHDDGHYVGRCYAPTENLLEKLNQGKCESFGVFHWMNRPLDLFFKGMIRQVWENTENESLEETSKIMARNYFGTEDMTEYFIHWINDAPIFGRATLMNFFHRPMKEAVYDFNDAISGCNNRIKMLKSADKSGMTAKQKEYIKYFETLEQFIIDFSDTQPHLLNAERYLANMELDSARQELSMGDPAECVRRFSKLGQIAKLERGEIAYTQRLAVKYIPDYLSFEQRAKLKPYRINVDSLVYEDLAQGSVNISYHIDPEGNFWESLGDRELSAEVLGLERNETLNDTLARYKEIFGFGAKLNSSITIPIRPIMRAPGIKDSKLVWEGRYRLKLLVASDEKSTFTAEINGQSFSCTSQGPEILDFDVEQSSTSLMHLIIKPVSGKVYVCGLELEPNGD